MNTSAPTCIHCGEEPWPELGPCSRNGACRTARDLCFEASLLTDFSATPCTELVDTELASCEDEEPLDNVLTILFRTIPSDSNDPNDSPPNLVG